MTKIKIYMCLSGFWDNKIDLITTSLKEAYDYADKSKDLIDVREYEILINKHQFTRPKRPNARA